MKYILFALLFASTGIKAQTAYFKEGGKWGTTDGSVYQIKNGKEVLIARDSSKPIPTVWASQESEIRELRKRLDSLIKTGRIDPWETKVIENINRLLKRQGLPGTSSDYILTDGFMNPWYLDSVAISPGKNGAPDSLRIVSKHFFGSTVIDSADHVIIHRSPDGWTSVTAMPEKKEKRRRKRDF